MKRGIIAQVSLRPETGWDARPGRRRINRGMIAVNLLPVEEGLDVVNTLVGLRGHEVLR